MPKISVIIPVYNVEKYLRECLDSVINQTLADIEIILVDDGSPDNCPQICDEYALKDNRIKVIHKENGGYGSAMNVGLEKATGEYIGIVEPDDYIDSKMYEDLYQIAKEFDSDIVKSCFYINLQTQELTQITRSGWLDYIPEDRSFTIQEYPQFLLYHPSVWSCIYKREFLNQNNIRFVEAPGAGWTDNPFQVQTMCLAKNINYTSKSYYFWRKLHINDYEEINDYNVPLQRAIEIHDWLTENNINNPKTLEFLYKRELYYLKVIFGMKKITNESDCYKKIKKICNEMNPKIIFGSKIINKRERALYEHCKNNPAIQHNLIKLKNIRKNIIKCRISSKEMYIILFGKIIMRKIYGKNM